MHSTADGTLTALNPARHDAAAPAFAASEPLDEGRYRGIWLQAICREAARSGRFDAGNAGIDQHDEIRSHDQSSSASRVTAGAFGFLTMIQ